MAESSTQRRLAAVVVADVVGYSRLMGLDEAGTLAALKQRRTVILEPTVKTLGGRIVKFMGDGVPIEFATSVNDNATPANSLGLGYSAANRLSSDSGPWGSSGWQYDATGNRIVETLGASTRVFDYPSNSNRIASETLNGTLVRSFTHDAAGNLTAGLPLGASYTVSYNQRNRPSGLSLNGTPIAAYLFNTEEQMASRTLSAPLSPAGTTHYIYDLGGHLIAEATGANAASAVIVREYIWLEDMPVMVVDDVNTATPIPYAAHADHLNRPIRLTDAARASVWSATWTPFGIAHAVTGTATQNLRFPGQYFLVEQGLAYNWHRFYDATTGRYTQPDPLGFPDGPGRYVYAGNSPLMYVDEDGRVYSAVYQAGRCALSAACRAARLF